MHIGTLSLVVWLSAAAAIAQRPIQSAKAGIINLTATEQASVHFQIQGKDKDIVIPYCEKDSEGSFVICGVGEVTLQYFDGKKWIRTKPGYPGEVFGVEDSQWNPAPVLAGSSVGFRFDFRPNLYHIQRGKRLRLLVYYWRDPEAMKSAGADGTFISPSFVCP